MPDLPTIAVTDAQAAGILTAFGGNLETAVPKYLERLTISVRDYGGRCGLGLLPSSSNIPADT